MADFYIIFETCSNCFVLFPRICNFMQAFQIYKNYGILPSSYRDTGEKLRFVFV